MHELSQRTRMWVEFQVDGMIIASQTLQGGTSSDLTLLEIETRNGKEEMVLREYTNKEWLEREPGIALQEAKNLSEAEKLAVKGPKLIAFDYKAENTPYPSLLMSKVEGQVLLTPSDFSNWIDQLAQVLVEIHQLTNPEIMHEYFRYFDPTASVKAGWSSCPEKWKEAFRILNNTKQPIVERSFIHRDFHPTNVLFKNEEASAVVDWSDACLGPKQIDIAHCRWNLAMMYGQKAAEMFLYAYQKASPNFNYDSYWDLEALGNVFTEDSPQIYEGWNVFGLSEPTAESMIQRMDNFLLKALGN
ncbi:MAG: aminoglycoside phosphotransferase family protein [Alkalibacterium sp.]|nr:aminoglycoside phosphotransferase family protein [Alkalibacterium sp.]